MNVRVRLTTTYTDFDEVSSNLSLGVHRSGGLANRALLFVIGREIFTVCLFVGNKRQNFHIARFEQVYLLGNRNCDRLATLGDYFSLIVGDVFERGATLDIGVVARHRSENLPVRSFDKSVIVEPRVSRKGTQQSDVGPFRRFDRADAPVVGGVHVADIEPGAFTGKTSGAKCR